MFCTDLLTDAMLLCIFEIIYYLRYHITDMILYIL